MEDIGGDPFKEWYEDELWEEEEEERQEEERERARQREARMKAAPEKERAALQRAKEVFETVGRDELDRRLEEMLLHPKVGVASQSETVLAWMTEEERRCMAWFDHDDRETFMKRSAWYDGDGWMIPYYRLMCDEVDLVSSATREGFASDYKARGIYYNLDLRGCDMATINQLIFEVAKIRNLSLREERFIRVADKLIEAAYKGNPRAMNAMGSFCEERRPRTVQWVFPKYAPDCKFTKAEAREWYRKSAEGGCVQGQRNYARVLFYGIGANPDADYKVKWQESETAVELYRDLAERGDGGAQYCLASIYAKKGFPSKNDVAECAKWLRLAAQNGRKKAVPVLLAAGDDTSDERLFAELLIALRTESLDKLRNDSDDYTIAYKIPVNPEFQEPSGEEKPDKGDVPEGDDWILKDKPKGTVLPPPAGRENVRIPNLTSANPSFAARLLIFIRDRFGGDAPAVYRAAHVSRKTYSAIVSNELRPVSKQTAIAFALAMHLPMYETLKLLRSAGYFLSSFYLEDIIVESCITAEIYDIDRVNKILSQHGAKPFPPGDPDRKNTVDTIENE